MKVQTYIVEKNGLLSEDIKLINKHCVIEFQSKLPINPQPYNEHWNDKYFLVKDENQKLLSFGKLQKIQVEILDQKFEIFGIATIVSIEKGKGYGKELMQNMREYIKKSDKTGIGFCGDKNSIFYRKCGFEIFKEQEWRFVFVNEKGEQVKAPHNGLGDVILLKGKDNFTRLFIKNPKEIVYTNRAHW